MFADILQFIAAAIQVVIDWLGAAPGWHLP